MLERGGQSSEPKELVQGHSATIGQSKTLHLGSLTADLIIHSLWPGDHLPHASHSGESGREHPPIEGGKQGGEGVKKTHLSLYLFVDYSTLIQGQFITLVILKKQEKSIDPSIQINI